jgi:ABC-2 type transport system ATP-binding protein
MEEAQRLCNRVAIIDRGRILDLDTVDKLIEKHGGKALIEAVLEKPPEDISAVPGTLEGDRLRVETQQPNEDLALLARSNLAFRQLRVDRPDLETVFLNLTGRSLRD